MDRNRAAVQARAAVATTRSSSALPSTATSSLRRGGDGSSRSHDGNGGNDDANELIIERHIAPPLGANMQVPIIQSHVHRQTDDHDTITTSPGGAGHASAKASSR
jgi:hypothetical protein